MLPFLDFFASPSVSRVLFESWCPEVVLWTTPLSRGGGLEVIYVQSSFSRRIHVKFTSHDICWFKSNAPVIHVDFSAESCPYHTRQWRISYRRFNQVHEHKGNILINFIVYISLIQIATESSVTAHFGVFSTLCWESIRVSTHVTSRLCRWWTGGPDPPTSKKKTSQMQGIFDESYHQLSSGVYRTPFSAPKISEMQKCKKKKKTATPLGWGERPRKSHKKHQNFHVWMIVYMVHSPKNSPCMLDPKGNNFQLGTGNIWRCMTCSKGQLSWFSCLFGDITLIFAWEAPLRQISRWLTKLEANENPPQPIVHCSCKVRTH